MAKKPVVTKNRVGRIVIGPVRLSYTHLAEADYDEKKEASHYKTKVLIPKDDKKLLAQIDAAIKAGAEKKFGAKAKKLMKSSKFGLPIRDPKAEDLDGKEYKGMLFFNCKSVDQPGMLLKNGTKLLTSEDIQAELYSGVWVNMSVSFYGFDIDGSKGVAVWLNNIVKHKDDKRLDGHVDAEDEMSEYVDESFDDGKGKKKKKPKKDKGDKPKKDKKKKGKKSKSDDEDI